MEIHERVKILRKEKLGLTQEEFSNKIKIGRANLASIELGRINITDRVISDICREFRVNEDWLRYGDDFGEMFISSSDEEIEALGKKYSLDSTTKAFIKAFFERTNELERKVVFDVIFKCISVIDPELIKDETEGEEE